MAETVNQGATANQEAGGAPEKTFTQAELDAIVRDRLKREREKYPDYDAIKEKADRFDKLEENSKTELQKATERAAALEKELTGIRNAEKVRAMREKVSEETGVPASLLTGETEDDCKEQAKQIAEYAKGSGYPKVKDGGEVTKTSKKDTRDKFAEWFNQIM